MSYISEKGASIFRRLFNRFKLKSTGSAIAVVGEEITPVTNIDDLLKTGMGSTSAAISAATTGWKTFLTVPANKRWYLRYITTQITSGTTARINTQGISKDGTTFYPIQSFTAATTSGTFAVTSQTQLDPGEVVGAYVSTANAGDEFTMSLWYDEEDAF